MTSLRMGFLLAVSLSLFSIGCASNGAKDENARLLRENQELRGRLDDSERAMRSSPDQSAAALQAKQNEISQLEQRIQDLEAQLQKQPATSGADPTIAGVETTYDRARGEMTVNLPGDVLFASGSAQLKGASRATLDKVVAALRRQYAGKRIRVEGHTDSDRIRASSDRWIDNLDLSLNRAAAVTRYLAEKGVNPAQIATVGWGDAKPKRTKAASRRVEIIVLVR